MDPNPLLRFDRFALDRANGRLSADGIDLELRPKSFDVLRHLAENHGRLVSKDELVRAVWPEVVVTDDSLVQCVHDVRKVLGDDRQRFIRTVPRRGYMFVADVQAEPPAVPRRQDQPLSSRYRPSWRLAAWACTLAAITVLAAWGWTSSGKASNPEGLTIAVLPFTDLSPGDERLFSDGLADDIITAISRFRDVTVIARNSSFRYRQEVDVRQVGRDLGARFLVAGGIGREAGRIRVTVHLLDARSGATRWAESYDRPMGSLFALRDEVAQQIVSTVVGHARHLTGQSARVRDPAALEVYELVLRARRGFVAFSREGAMDAHAVLLQAVALEPDYAPAWELLARVLLRFYIVPYDGRHASSLVLDEAHRAALKAVALDPTFSLAHGALGYAQLWLRQYDASLTSLRRAIDLNPNDADTWRNYGDALGKVGEHRASIVALERARRVDPYSPPIVFALMARAHNMLGEHDQALLLARECVERAPDLPACFLMSAIASARLGDHAEAQAAIQQLRQVDPKTSLRQWTQPKRFRHEADEALWAEHLRTTGLVH